MRTGYRYSLTRRRLIGEGRVCWVMLNPSTADDFTDDPTERRVRRFSWDHGYQELSIVNLFAMRATNPTELLTAEAPLGDPDRFWSYIGDAMGYATAVVFAWGASIPPKMLHQADAMIDFAGQVGVTAPLCLGTTKAGQPRHPLYVKASERLRPFALEVSAA